MRIGIDIDDTLISTSESYDNVVKKYNLNINKKFNELFTKSELKLVFDKYVLEVLMEAEFKENAKNIINDLYNNGHEIYIITARNNYFHPHITNLTTKLINDNISVNDIYYDQVIKSDLAKKLNIDLMIDDNINVYNNMKKENIDCILFGNKIKTWKEVLEYIKKKEEDDG